MCREAAVPELAAWIPGIALVQMWVCDLVMSRFFQIENCKLKMENCEETVLENVIEKKSFLFAVRIVNLCKYIRSGRKEYMLTRQLLRSGTSIGANIAESQQAQSRADFVSKLSISLKETAETKYWL